MFLLFKYAWDSFKPPFSPCFAYEKPVVLLIFLHGRWLKCVWCVRTSWNYHETDCEHNARDLEISLMFVMPNTCRSWTVFMFIQVFMSGMNVSRFAYFCYALKVCTSHMIVNYFLERSLVRWWLWNSILAYYLHLLCTFFVCIKYLHGLKCAQNFMTFCTD